MAILNKIGNVAKNIGDKAGGVVETTKLNSKISAEKNLIEGVYKKIGEYYYLKHQSGEKLPKEAAALCAEIDGHNSAINDAKAEIERIKAETASPAASAATVSCSACGSKNAAGRKFCQECGAKLEAKPQASARRVCACGAEVPPGRKFCSECGTEYKESGAKLKEKPQAPARRVCVCGAEVPPGRKFCGECGAKIEEGGKEQGTKKRAKK